MMLQMLGVFAEFEHATIVERTKVGMEKKAKGGRFVGGKVPFGYRLDPEKGLVVHEEEALIVRKLFRMYAIGKIGSSAICKEFNVAGSRKRNGRKWGRRVAIYMIKNPVYVGKIRWREVLYDGTHEPLVSEELFEKAQEVLAERDEDLRGRRFRHGENRLLTGVIKCAKCGSNMFGNCGRKGGVTFTYYACSKRANYQECDQDYVRSDLLDGAIIQDIKSMFGDEHFMARVWEEANKRLTAERPNVEKEIDANFAEAAKVQAAMDRYFKAFETGKLEASLCNEKVKALRAQLDELEASRKDLEARREALELPAIDRQMLASLLDQFEKVLATGTGAQRKDLLHRVVKKVLVHDRRTVEVWYALPNRADLAISNNWLAEPSRIRTFANCDRKMPKRSRFRTRRDGPPEVWFRILHIGRGLIPEAELLEQRVEIALGSKGAFENGNVGIMTRRVTAGRVVNAAVKALWPPKPPRPTRTPRIVELLRTAQEWRRQLNAREVETQAEIARREGLTRARVTQVLGLLRLAPEIQACILELPDTVRRSAVTEHAIRTIIRIDDPLMQVAAFKARAG
jgi:hypothetical protein